MPVILILAFVRLGVSQPSQVFLDKVLNKLDCHDCYYVTVKFQTPKFKGIIAVENDDLFAFLNKTKGWDFDKYKEEVQESVLKGNPIVSGESLTPDKSSRFLEGEGLEAGVFRIVETAQSFEVINNKGCHAILSYYFRPNIEVTKKPTTDECRSLIRSGGEDLFLRPNVEPDEASAIIAFFFELSIPIAKDDISGTLRIGHLAIP